MQWAQSKFAKRMEVTLGVLKQLPASPPTPIWKYPCNYWLWMFCLENCIKHRTSETVVINAQSLSSFWISLIRLAVSHSSKCVTQTLQNVDSLSTVYRFNVMVDFKWWTWKIYQYDLILKCVFFMFPFISHSQRWWLSYPMDHLDISLACSELFTL